MISVTQVAVLKCLDAHDGCRTISQLANDMGMEAEGVLSDCTALWYHRQSGGPRALLAPVNDDKIGEDTRVAITSAGREMANTMRAPVQTEMAL